MMAIERPALHQPTPTRRLFDKALGCLNVFERLTRPNSVRLLLGEKCKMTEVKTYETTTSRHRKISMEKLRNKPTVSCMVLPSRVDELARKYVRFKDVETEPLSIYGMEKIEEYPRFSYVSEDVGGGDVLTHLNGEYGDSPYSNGSIQSQSPTPRYQHSTQYSSRNNNSKDSHYTRTLEDGDITELNLLGRQRRSASRFRLLSENGNEHTKYTSIYGNVLDRIRSPVSPTEKSPTRHSRSQRHSIAEIPPSRRTYVIESSRSPRPIVNETLRSQRQSDKSQSPKDYSGDHSQLPKRNIPNQKKPPRSPGLSVDENGKLRSPKSTLVETSLENQSNGKVVNIDKPVRYSRQSNGHNIENSGHTSQRVVRSPISPLTDDSTSPRDKDTLNKPHVRKQINADFSDRIALQSTSPGIEPAFTNRKNSYERVNMKPENGDVRGVSRSGMRTSRSHLKTLVKMDSVKENTQPISNLTNGEAQCNPKLLLTYPDGQRRSSNTPPGNQSGTTPTFPEVKTDPYKTVLPRRNSERQMLEYDATKNKIHFKRTKSIWDMSNGITDVQDGQNKENQLGNRRGNGQGRSMSLYPTPVANGHDNSARGRQLARRGRFNTLTGDVLRDKMGIPESRFKEDGEVGLLSYICEIFKLK